MAANPPPTHIIVHPKERRSKCSVQHLRTQPGFIFTRYPHRPELPLGETVRLGIGGPLLSEADCEKTLLVLDGTWRFAEMMERDYQALPIRSLPEIRTAYPRVSKLFEDPTQGLATIEAIYAAYIMLGRKTDGLLDGYRWGNRFLALNEEFLAEYCRG